MLFVSVLLCHDACLSERMGHGLSLREGSEPTQGSGPTLFAANCILFVDIDLQVLSIRIKFLQNHDMQNNC